MSLRLDIDGAKELDLLNLLLNVSDILRSHPLELETQLVVVTVLAEAGQHPISLDLPSSSQIYARVGYHCVDSLLLAVEYAQDALWHIAIVESLRGYLHFDDLMVVQVLQDRNH